MSEFVYYSNVRALRCYFVCICLFFCFFYFLLSISIDEWRWIYIYIFVSRVGRWNLGSTVYRGPVCVSHNVQKYDCLFLIFHTNKLMINDISEYTNLKKNQNI